MNISAELKEKIIQGLIENGTNYGKIAKKHSTSTMAVEHIDITVNGRYNYTPEGKGPENLQMYIIARQDLRYSGGWDNKDERIKKARVLYDEGKIEMVTGRDGFFLLLYAIPRHKQIKRKPYFTAPIEQPTGNVVRMA